MNRTFAPARVVSIDGLRGLLATLVMFAHYPYGPFHDALTAPSRLAVMAFFMMSGYVLTRAWDGRFGVFLVGRFLRLWPVFAACLLAGGLVLQEWPQWTYYFWYPFFGDHDRMKFDPPMWSLFVEAWAMIAMPAIVWGGRSLARFGLVAAAFVLAALFERNFSYGLFFLGGSFLSTRPFDVAWLNAKVPQWLGKISYSLYLTHCIVMGVCDIDLPTIAPYVQIPLSLLAAVMTYALIERPSIALSRSVKRAMGRGLAPLTGHFADRSGANVGSYAAPRPTRTAEVGAKRSYVAAGAHEGVGVIDRV